MTNEEKLLKRKEKKMIKENFKYIKLYEDFVKNDFINTIIHKLGYKLKKERPIKYGSFKLCFELNNNKVIKFFQCTNNDYVEIYNSIKQKELKLDVLSKIYSVGKITYKNKEYINDFFYKLPLFDFQSKKDIYFIIDENLKNDKSIANEIRRIDKEYKSIEKEFMYNDDLLIDLQEGLYTEDEGILEDINIFKDSTNNPLLDRLYHIYLTWKNNGIVVTDSNSSNFRRNNKGEIVLFDLDDLLDFNKKDIKISDNQLDYIF